VHNPCTPSFPERTPRGQNTAQFHVPHTAGGTRIHTVTHTEEEKELRHPPSWPVTVRPPQRPHPGTPRRRCRRCPARSPPRPRPEWPSAHAGCRWGPCWWRPAGRTQAKTTTFADLQHSQTVVNFACFTFARSCASQTQVATLHGGGGGNGMRPPQHFGPFGGVPAGLTG
jgi:hypothetical protein